MTTTITDTPRDAKSEPAKPNPEGNTASPTPHADSPWTRYKPTAEAPWDLRRVVHLHRRAGFAATWAELKRDLEEGPEASIDRVLAGSSRLGGYDDFEATANLLADAAVASGDINRLEAWWIFRMLASPDPLGERLTLMWHDHFATAQSKVEDLALMRRQNDTFRRLARAPFGDLLNASVREPALLLYLDAPSNRKGHPNENLARELMELFTLGVGNFTEADVQGSRPGPDRLDGRRRRVPRSAVEARRRRKDAPRSQTGDWPPPTFSRSCSTSPRPHGGSRGGFAAFSWAKGLSTEPTITGPCRRADRATGSTSAMRSRRSSARGRFSLRQTSVRGWSGRSSS